MSPEEWQKSVKATFRVRPGLGARGDFMGECFIAPSGCWPHNGDCTLVIGGIRPAQRVAYAMLVGPLRRDESVESTCETRNCCHPQHLRKIVSQKQRGAA